MLNKLFLMLLSASFTLFAANPNNGHSSPHCGRLEIILRSNFTSSEIHRAILVCECCKKRAFTTLIHFVENFEYEKSQEISDLFIRNGISVNDLNDRGHLPLANAAQFKKLNAVNLLISLGADVNKKSGSNHTALYEAIYSHTFDAEDQLTRLNIIKSLLKAGANPNELFIFDMPGVRAHTITPLYAVTAKTDYLIVYLLLIYVANPYIKVVGQTFFEYAENKPITMKALEKYRNYVQKILTRHFIAGIPGIDQLISEYAVIPKNR